MRLHELRQIISRYLVTDVPDELAACLDCGHVQCRDERFIDCPNRLRRVEALRASRTCPCVAPAAAAPWPEALHPT